MTKRSGLTFLLAVDAAVTLAALGVADLAARYFASLKEASFNGSLICDNFVTPKDSALGLSIAALAAFILCRCILNARLPRPKLGLSGVFLLLWLLSSIVSALLSGHAGYSLGDLKPALLYFFIYLLFRTMNGGRGGKTGEDTLAVMTIFAALFALHGILQYSGIEIFTLRARVRLADSPSMSVYSLFGNSHLFADFLAVSLPAAMALAALRPRRPVKNILSAVAIILIGTALVLTSSRTGLVAAAAGVILFATLSLQVLSNRKIALAFSAAVIVAVIAVVTFFSFFMAHKMESVKLRTLYLKTSIAMVKEKPLLGCGPGCFRLNYLDYQKDYFAQNRDFNLEKGLSIEKPNHPHNEFLNSAVETGLIGAAMLAMALASGIVLGIRTASPRDYGAAAWTAILASLAVSSFFGFPIRIPTTGLLLPVSLAVIDSMNTAGGNLPARVFEVPFFRRFTAKWGTVCIILCLFFIVSEQQFRLVESRIHFTNAKKYLGMLKPAEAYDSALSALNLYPENGEYEFTAGAALHMAGYPEKALTYYNSATVTSSDPNLYVNMSMAYFETGDIKRAVEIMEDVERTVPGYLKAKIMLARYFLSLGEREKAEMKLNEALLYEPYDVEARTMLRMIRGQSEKSKTGSE